MTINGLCLSDGFVDQGFNWDIDRNTVRFEKEAIKAGLLGLEKPCFIVKENNESGDKQ